MSEEAYTGFTVSFKPGGTGYDSPMLVVRGNTEEELLRRLDADPLHNDIGSAVANFHAKLRQQFDAIVGGAPVPVQASAPAAPAPIWASAPPSASGGLTPNPDGTYPPCQHGNRPRKPWTSPRTNRTMLFCSLDKGTPGACATVTL